MTLDGKDNFYLSWEILGKVDLEIQIGGISLCRS